MIRFIEYSDSRNEPPTEFKYESKRSVTLEKALVHHFTAADDLCKLARHAKLNCYYPSPHSLTLDESSTIYVYAKDFGRLSLHRNILIELQTGTESRIEPWLNFLALFYSGLRKLPKVKSAVFRIIHYDVARKLRTGSVVYWWNILSCSSTIDSFKNYLSSEYVLCLIDTFSGVDIGQYSRSEFDNEIIILPGTGFYVLNGYYDKSGGSRIIRLREQSDDRHTETSSMTSFVDSVSKRPETYFTSVYYVEIKHVSKNDYHPLQQGSCSVTTFSNGDRYEKREKKRLYQSYTILFASDGNEYFNADADIRANGTGTRIWSNGDRYEGSFETGRKHGQGTLRCADGYIYEGHWLNDVINGEGKSSWPNEFEYNGVHRYGRITGYGILSSPTGDHYRGQLVDGKADGHGERKWSNGDFYRGEFENDKKHGHGKYTFAKGGFYVGYWFNDQMNGKGTFEWPSGTKYIGMFDHGKKDGEGTLYFVNGCIQYGWWENDTFAHPMERS